MPRKKKAEQEQDNIKMETETRTLFHKFNEDDINAVNEKIAELSEKKNEFDEKRKFVTDIVKGCAAEIALAIKSKNDGGEDRQMDCSVEINYTIGKRIVKHPETGEILEERFLTADEKQDNLFPTEGKESLLDAEHAEEVL